MATGIFVASQIFVNGLTLGLLYSLIALGFSLLFGVLGVLNFAHGAFFMIGAFIVYNLTEILGMPYLISLFVSMLIVFVVGIILERVLFRPLRTEIFATVIASLALGIFMEAMAIAVTGGTPRLLTSFFRGTVSIGSVQLSMARIGAITISLVALLTFILFLQRTRFGRAIRATADDAAAASAQGINVHRVYSITFGLGVAIAALAGGLVAPIFGLTPEMGTPAMLMAFTVVILGGLGSIAGAVLGGLILGMLESVTATLISAEVAGIVGFVVILLTLIFRPIGLLGREIS
jgi:branched-chain amino acid transport system permease protein